MHEIAWLERLQRQLNLGHQWLQGLEAVIGRDKHDNA
jgi:hypothetical protein